MENWIFKILGNIELVNKRLFYLLEPYATKIISHIKENTLGSIMLIIIVIIIFRNINKLFKKKYGHSMINITYLILSPGGTLIYGGKYWLEYAIRNNKVKWYPICFILFFFFSITYLYICIIIRIIKEKKDLVILLIFSIATGILGGVEGKNTYIIEQRNDTVGPNL